MEKRPIRWRKISAQQYAEQFLPNFLSRFQTAKEIIAADEKAGTGTPFQFPPPKK